MNLDISKWGKFRIGNLFYKLENGKANDGMLDDGDERIYLGAKKDDNGVMRHCASNLELEQDGNCIIFICNGQGSVGYANYMNDTFIGTSDIVAGYCDNMNEFIGEFMATVFCLERPKYSFGRKWKTHLRDTIVKLPIQYNTDGTLYIDPDHTYSEEGYVPDWQFMEDYIKSLHYKPLTTTNKSTDVLPLDIENWKEFNVGNFFDIHPTKALKDVTSSDCVEGGVTPLVVNQSYNNGVAGNVNYGPTEKGGIITFSDTWEGETFFYQHYDFIGFSHVQGMYPRCNMSEEVLIFMATMLEFEAKDRYSYGRKKRRDLISKSYIKLPIECNEDGTPFIDEKHTYSDDGYVPDWKFMEDFIKSLPYGDRL